MIENSLVTAGFQLVQGEATRLSGFFFKERSPCTPLKMLHIAGKPLWIPQGH